LVCLLAVFVPKLTLFVPTLSPLLPPNNYS